jgi:hypothetical protein
MTGHPSRARWISILTVCDPSLQNVGFAGVPSQSEDRRRLDLVPGAEPTFGSPVMTCRRNEESDDADYW